MKPFLFFIAVLPVFGQWASPGIGFDFRGSTAYVTDPSSTQAVQGNGDGNGQPSYPTTTTIGGVSVTWGWETSGGLPCGSAATGFDQSTSVDVRLAGVGQLPPNFQCAFRVDLPTTGSYVVTVAEGSNQVFGFTGVYARLYDTTTLVATIASNGSLTGPEWYDASGVLRTSAANWVSGNATVTKTFTTTIFRYLIGDTTSGGYCNVAHIRIQTAPTSTVVPRRH